LEHRAGLPFPVAALSSCKTAPETLNERMSLVPHAERYHSDDSSQELRRAGVTTLTDQAKISRSKIPFPEKLPSSFAIWPRR